jgi:hypothetical protein
MNDLSFYDSLFMTLVLVSLEFFLGYVYLKSNGPSWASWAFPGIAVVVTHLVCIGQPPPFRLVALVVVLFAGMKIVMARHYPKLSFNLKKWALYCFG